MHSLLVFNRQCAIRVCSGRLMASVEVATSPPAPAQRRAGTKDHPPIVPCSVRTVGTVPDAHEQECYQVHSPWRGRPCSAPHPRTIHQDVSTRDVSDLHDQEFTLLAPHVAHRAGQSRSQPSGPSSVPQESSGGARRGWGTAPLLGFSLKRMLARPLPIPLGRSLTAVGIPPPCF